MGNPGNVLLTSRNPPNISIRGPPDFRPSSTLPHSSHIHPHHPSHTHPPQMNNMGTNGPTNGPNSWRAPSAGNLPSLPGMNSSASEREEPNFPPGNKRRLKRLLALEPSINTLKRLRECHQLQPLMVLRVVVIYKILANFPEC